MDYTPRAENIRLLAMAAYLPMVAVFLLVSRRTRDVRLIRFHAYQAIGLFFWLFLMLLLGSALATVLGGLPGGVGLLVNLAVGFFFVGMLLGVTGVWFYGAAMAYQANFTAVPFLTDWVWAQVNGSGRAAPRKRRAKRR